MSESKIAGRLSLSLWVGLSVKEDLFSLVCVDNGPMFHIAGHFEWWIWVPCRTVDAYSQKR